MRERKKKTRKNLIPSKPKLNEIYWPWREHLQWMNFVTDEQKNSIIYTRNHWWTFGSAFCNLNFLDGIWMKSEFSIQMPFSIKALAHLIQGADFFFYFVALRFCVDNAKWEKTTYIRSIFFFPISVLLLLLKSEPNVVRMFWILFRFGPPDYKWLDSKDQWERRSYFRLKLTAIFLWEKRWLIAFAFISRFIHKSIQIQCVSVCVCASNGGKGSKSFKLNMKNVNVIPPISETDCKFVSYFSFLEFIICMKYFHFLFFISSSFDRFAHFTHDVLVHSHILTKNSNWYTAIRMWKIKTKEKQQTRRMH